MRNRHRGNTKSEIPEGWTGMRIKEGKSLIFRHIGVAILCTILVGCASSQTVWLPEGNSKPPKWLSKAQNSPPEGTLLGIGKSDRSEEMARAAAMADIDRQILQMIPLQHLSLESERIRRNEVLDVWHRMNRSSEASFGSPWQNVLHQACMKFTPRDRTERPVWTYYVLVRFGEETLEKIIRRVEQSSREREEQHNYQIATYRHRIQEISARARRALDQGKFRTAFFALSELTHLRTPPGSESGGSARMAALRIVSEFLDHLRIRLSSTWNENECDFIVTARVQSSDGLPIKGMPLEGIVEEGRGRVEQRLQVTGSDGMVEFQVYPQRPGHLRFQARPAIEESILDEGNDEATFGLPIEELELQVPTGPQVQMKIRSYQEWQWVGLLVWKRPKLERLTAVIEVLNEHHYPITVVPEVESVVDESGRAVSCPAAGHGIFRWHLAPGEFRRRSLSLGAVRRCINRNIEERSAPRAVAASFRLVFKVRSQGSCPWSREEQEFVQPLVPPRK